MAFTEFYANASTGSNLNAGSTQGAPVLTNTGGSWVQATRVFTCSGSPDLSGITAGMWGSVYADGAAAPTGYISRVTAVDNGLKTITLSTTAQSGSAPVDGGSNRTIVIGGAWLGPNGASGFPFSFLSSTAIDASGNLPRCNYKNNAVYNTTAVITFNQSDVFHFGYSTVVDDGGIAEINNGTTAANGINVSGSRSHLENFKIASTQTVGTTIGINSTRQ